MTGGIYDHLLIIGTLYRFIKGMTNAWLLHNFLIWAFLVILQKSSRKNYASTGILERELLESGLIFSRPRDPWAECMCILSGILTVSANFSRARSVYLYSRQKVIVYLPTSVAYFSPEMI